MSTITFDAEVTHHFSKGFRAKEPGERGYKFTVWSDERPPIGSQVRVTGRLGAKVENYQDKPYIGLSVNEPTVQVLADTQTATTVQSGAQSVPTDDWGTVAPSEGFDSETPF